MDFSRLSKTSLLYSGGSVRVYRGLYDIYPVVIKELFFQTAADATRALSEFHTQQSLSHPNICKVFDCQQFNSDLSLCLVLESMECDLAKEVENRRKHSFPWTEDELWGHFWVLISTLAYAQENNVCHRDLKPQNIFLTNTKEMKLGDFGTAKNVQFVSAMTFVGTPYFMSPELKQRFSSIKAAPMEYNPFTSDVFSLGLTFLYMINLQQSPALSSIEKLEIGIQQEIASLQVSDLMKGLIAWMLSLHNRPDFLQLRDYFQRLYQPTQTAEEPLDTAQEEAVQPEPEAAPVAVERTAVDRSGLEWRLKNEQFYESALREAFEWKLDVTFHCYCNPICCICNEQFTVYIAAVAIDRQFCFCSDTCSEAYEARQREVIVDVQVSAEHAEAKGTSKLEEEKKERPGSSSEMGSKASTPKQLTPVLETRKKSTSYAVRMGSAKKAGAAYPVRMGSAKKVGAVYPVRMGSAKKAGAAYPVRMGSAKKAGAAYPVRMGSAKKAGAAYPVRMGSAKKAGAVYPVRMGSAKKAGAAYPVRMGNAKKAGAVVSKQSKPKDSPGKEAPFLP